MTHYKILNKRNGLYILNRIAKKQIYSNNLKVKKMDKNYTYASTFVFSSLVLSSLAVFSNFAKADPDYCAYIALGAIIFNSVALFFVYANIKSPSDVHLENINRSQELENMTRDYRDQTDSLWRTIDRHSESIEKLENRLDTFKKHK